MPLLPLVTGVLETALNALISQNTDAKSALLRLKGRVLVLQLREFSAPLVLVFSDRVDILAAWEGEADCRIHTDLLTLSALRDRRQITRLIREQALDVQGDIQLLQPVQTLFEQLDLDPATLLAPYTGDIVAHGVSRVLRGTLQAVQQQHQRNEHYVAQVLTEEWRLAPGGLEVAYFADQVDALAVHLAGIEQRLARLEKQP
ncbi:MAG: ubiquinone biosynthesis accessory factor UbiJ [Plesiomonas sp.]